MKQKRNALLITLISFWLPVFLFAGQQFQEEITANGFVKRIDGIGNLIAASQTSDRKYLIVSGESGTITISKLSSSGTKLWMTSFETSSYLNSVAHIISVAEANDGYLLAGFNRDPVTEGAILIKLDTSGNIVWSKQSNSLWYLTSVTAQPKGTFLAVGLARDPQYPVLIKFSHAGDVLWTKTFSQFAVQLDDWGVPNYFPTSVATPDDGIVMAVREFRYDLPSRVYMFKINSDGDITWTRKITMSGFVGSIHVTSDGGILLLVPDENTVVRLDARTRPQWAARYRFDGMSLTDVIETPDGGYELVGSRIVYGTPPRGELVEDGSAILLSIDEQGKILSQKKVAKGKSGSGQTIFHSGDHGYVMFASKLSKTENGNQNSILMAKTDSQGRVPGCHFSRASKLVKSENISGIETRKFRLKKTSSLSLNFSQLTLFPRETNESINSICE